MSVRYFAVASVGRQDSNVVTTDAQQPPVSLSGGGPVLRVFVFRQTVETEERRRASEGTQGDDGADIIMWYKNGRRMASCSGTRFHQSDL